MKGLESIIKLYARLIVYGERTIDEVPELLRTQVGENLESTRQEMEVVIGENTD